MPEEYEEAYICHSLRITHTELQKQPYSWVRRMMEFNEMRLKAEEAEYKRQSKKKTKAI